MLATLFREITTVLRAIAPAQSDPLAPIARTVMASDESTLDQVARTLSALRDVPPGDRRLLPGKVAAVFDTRLQLIRHVQFILEPLQNEKWRPGRCWPPYRPAFWCWPISAPSAFAGSTS